MQRKDSAGSFTFHRTIFTSTKLNPVKMKNRSCRQRLQNRFECGTTSNTNEKGDRSVLSILSLNDPRRVLRNSAEKISRTLTTVRTTIGSLSQKFRSSTKRRQLLEEGPSTPCATPQSHTRQVLGRTPTKLYSPFGIESPRNGKENQPHITYKHKPKKSLKTQREVSQDINTASSSLLR